MKDRVDVDIRRCIHFLDEFMAVLGIIQVDDGHRRFFDEVIPKQDREQDGADDGDQHGDLFVPSW